MFVLSFRIHSNLRGYVDVLHLFRHDQYPFARMMRSGLSAENTRVVRERSPRFIVKSGLSTSTVSRGTSRMALRFPLASTQATSSLQPSSLIRIDGQSLNEKTARSPPLRLRLPRSVTFVTWFPRPF